MSPSLDKYLCKTFPKIFVERKLSPRESCMGRGFECGDGWFPLLVILCRNIQRHIDWNNEIVMADDTNKLGLAKKKRKKTDRKLIPQFVALQVKEKFGALRIYHQGGDEYCQGLVDMAASVSWWTCEVCGIGGPQHVGHTKGWIQSTCPKCANAFRDYDKKVIMDKEYAKLLKRAEKERIKRYARR